MNYALGGVEFHMRNAGMNLYAILRRDGFVDGPHQIFAVKENRGVIFRVYVDQA